MIEKHLIKLRARDEISAQEEEAIRGSVARQINFRAGAIVVEAHQVLTVSMILLSGIACRQKIFPDGTRQITEMHIAGDFTDLHSFTLKYLDHDVAAITDCTFAVIPHKALQEISERHPHLTRVYWFGTNLDAAIHREWELSLGRRNATERLAHLFCELYLRLEIVGMAKNGQYHLPVTQAHLSECLGISPVHFNRTLQKLRGEGNVEFSRGIVKIYDFEALKHTAVFDPAYLYLERRKR
jgi:CRP-like cAMP-binding protein